MSYKVERTGIGKDRKYFVDFYGDTGTKDIYFMTILGHINFSTSLHLVEPLNTDYCKAELFNFRGPYDSYRDTYLSNFAAYCNGKNKYDMPCGKVLIARFVFTTDSPDANHVLIFNDDMNEQSAKDNFDGTGNILSYNKMRWVSGYSNIIDLDKRDPSECGDCKKVGDYDCDGTVNGLDYSWWKQEFVDKVQHDGKWEASHVCGDEVVPEDYSVWRYNYLE
jgi:hypothetical protein